MTGYLWHFALGESYNIILFQYFCLRVVLVSYVTGLSLATAGMPIIPATGLGVVTDWYEDNGEYAISKTYSSNVLGNVVGVNL